MTTETLFPWQSKAWQRLLGMRERMPHALLLQGRAGIGKLAFAQALAHALLCESPAADGMACGRCLSCGWLEQGNHPDFRQVEPEDRAESESETGGDAEPGSGKTKKKSRYIVVDQIRALQELTALTTHRQGLRIMLLQPAETLNANAANALLKMLEEPPPATLFILVSHQAQRLLPTIRSRCHKIDMPVPSCSESQAWLAEQGVGATEFCLAQAGGAPLAALEFDNASMRQEIDAFAAQLTHGARIDAFGAAAAWARNDFGMAVAALQRWSYDLLAARLVGQVRYFPQLLSSLQAMGNGVDLRLLLEFQRTLMDARAQAAHALNTELQLEALLVRYAQLFPGPTRI